MSEPLDVQTNADPKHAARSAGLRYVSDEWPGIRRKRSGKGFTYTSFDGSRIAERNVLRRVKTLAIPPAWEHVWICPFPDGHIQATGRDAKGRKQYRYHPRFREVRESTKYEHLVAFAEALPGLRKQVREHMSLHGLCRDKVLATVVHLLDTTFMRVGNEDYVKQNSSYGITTLTNRHAVIRGAEVRFRFTGKSGRQWSLTIKDRRVAKIVKACQELPGQKLVEYLDDDGHPQVVTSTDVNGYLKEITGNDTTTKDFRTWAGTVLAATALSAMQRFESTAGAKRNVKAAIERVAARLGNTPTICRKCYVHPHVFDAYLDGSLALRISHLNHSDSELREIPAELNPEEAAVLLMLQSVANAS